MLRQEKLGGGEIEREKEIEDQRRFKWPGESRESAFQHSGNKCSHLRNMTS